MAEAHELRIYSATSFLGHGVDANSLRKALEFQPHAIVAQGTTTDAGPSYLGSGKPVMARQALQRDLELIVAAAQEAGIPFICSVGGAGAKPHVELALELLEETARRHGWSLTIGVVWSDVDPQYLLDRLQAGVVMPRLVPVDRFPERLDAETVKASTRIVAQVGPEVLVRLLEEHPDLDGIITGRALDIGLYAALPLRHGFPRALSMHFGKVMEDGALAADPGSGNDGLMGFLRQDHFEVVPVSEERRCTPASVALHAFYERPDPTREANPGGVLDVASARYEQVTERSVRVSGARWIEADEYRVKLEGVRKAGCRSISIGGVRDPRFIAASDQIVQDCYAAVREYFAFLGEGAYHFTIRTYGKNGVLGPSEPLAGAQPHEICLLLEAVSRDQETADSICSFASSFLSHHGFPGRLSTAGNLAIPFSPGRAISAGEVYQWSIWHGLPLEDPGEPFRVEVRQIGGHAGREEGKA